MIIPLNSWWRKRSSHRPYCVGYVDGDYVWLFNEKGCRDGKIPVEQFKTEFYKIRGQ